MLCDEFLYGVINLGLYLHLSHSDTLVNVPKTVSLWYDAKFNSLRPSDAYMRQ